MDCTHAKHPALVPDGCMGALRNLHGRSCCLTRGSRESTDRVGSRLEDDPELRLLLSKPPRGPCRCTCTLRRLPASSSRRSSVHPSPSSPMSYWEYGSGLVPKRGPQGWCLPAPPWPSLTLQGGGGSSPWKTPHLLGRGWEERGGPQHGGEGGNAPPVPPSAGQGTVHPSSIFGGAGREPRTRCLGC